MYGRTGFARPRGLWCTIGLLACGGQPGSTGEADDASGDAGIASDAAPSSGDRAGGRDVDFPECPALPPRCPSKVLSGDVFVSASNPASNYAGVTEIKGGLDLRNAQGIAALDCLEVVGGDVNVDVDARG